jgi:hypothetical protein
MGARVVDWARLESVCTARYRGFESLPIRHSFRRTQIPSSMRRPFLRRKSRIVPQLFCSVILISRTSPQFRSFGLSELLSIETRKLLYLGREKRNMLPIMRWQRCSWFLALLAVGAALFLASCANQEGVGPAEGELKDRPPGAATGY